MFSTWRFHYRHPRLRVNAKWTCFSTKMFEILSTCILHWRHRFNPHFGVKTPIIKLWNLIWTDNQESYPRKRKICIFSLLFRTDECKEPTQHNLGFLQSKYSRATLKSSVGLLPIYGEEPPMTRKSPTQFIAHFQVWCKWSCVHTHVYFHNVNWEWWVRSYNLAANLPARMTLSETQQLLSVQKF